MKVNIIANALRTQKGEFLSVDMLKAELVETQELTATTVRQKVAKELHIKSLQAAIQYKQNRIK